MALIFKDATRSHRTERGKDKMPLLIDVYPAFSWCYILHITYYTLHITHYTLCITFYMLFSLCCVLYSV